MNIYSLVSAAATVLTFVAFIGIVVWAWSKKRRTAFDEAANAPFALPDDTVQGARAGSQPAERRK